ncbi:MAG: DUF3604 domain-containing protein [SAR324 cluster bacterium]|jgi:hypothetical protein|nr:DUF3604 domain-containing protein [SAR324 cluster bacterium]
MGKVVASQLVGDVWPSAQPGADPVLYGHVSLDPVGAFEVRSLQTFRLVYTVGRYGIDDTGSIRVVFRVVGDWGFLQMNEPKGYNFVTANTNTKARLSLDYSGIGHQRPWFKSLTVRLHGGYLSEGDIITITFGDTSQGSPGMKMQTFCEPGFEFKVLADVCAVGHYYPLVKTPHISIVPGEVHQWKAVLPTLRHPSSVFRLGIKAEDNWGNPTDKASGQFTLKSTHPVEGLPNTIDYPLGVKSLILDQLKVKEPGVVRIQMLDETGTCVAEAGPLLIEESGFSGYWGDLHGQSGESIGITTSREYFEFARNKAFLDVTGHQANDFQVNNAFWKYLNELTDQYHEDGRFVVFPGYEWSGNTAVGGDRNVFFRNEGRQIRRSSHALLSDRRDIDTDSPSAAQLFEDLQDEDCVVYAHVGGRYADIAQAHDPRLETAMEIHSAWGTFEWLLTDGFPLGHRSGVVCNSDGHKGRPGASYPGAATFGAYGGLTCFLTRDLTRDGIFECLRRRHHYGTTGCRMHMDVKVQFDQESTIFERDPKAFPDTNRFATNEVMMGDIVQSPSSEATLKLSLLAHNPIERIEIRNGENVLDTFRPYTPNNLGNRIRVIWSGAEYRGRGRQCNWTGSAVFKGCRIKQFVKINAWNHERRLEQCNHNTVEWDTFTTGNFGGFDVWLEEGPAAELDLTTNRGSIQEALEDIGLEDIIMEAGGLERRLRVFRLPEDNPHREVEYQLRIPLKPEGDNQLWICVTTEDGFQAWSSPVFVYR